MLVVSGDKQFGQAAKAIEDIEHIQNLSQALDNINARDATRANFVKYEILKRRDEIKKWATMVFEDRGFEVAGRYEGEVQETRVTSISLTDSPEDLNLIELGDNHATVVTPVDVEFEADLEYGDDGAFSYDAEIGPIFWDAVRETVDEKLEDAELELRVSFDGLDRARFSVEKGDFPDLGTIQIETSAEKDWRANFR